MSAELNRWSRLARRDFSRIAAKSLLGVSVLPGASQLMGQSKAARARKVIYFYLSGGMSHIDSFDPKPGSEVQGPTEAIGTSAGFQLSANFQAVASQSDRFSVIRTMTSQTGDHQGGRYYVRTGYKRLASIVHPDLAAWKKKLAPMQKKSTLPFWVSIRDGSFPGDGFMGPNFAPVPLGNPTSGLPNSLPMVDEGAFQERLEMVNTFNEMFTRRFRTKEVRAYNEFYEHALKLMTSEDLDAFDLSKMPTSRREKFGSGQGADAAALAVQLNENDVEYVHVNWGGWDNHSGIFESGPSRNFQGLSQALAGTLEEVNLEDTMVVLATEFGRSPRINENRGRDHHPLAFSALVAGAGIKGGQAYGRTDKNAYAVEDDPVRPEDFNATLATAMGIPIDKVVFSPSGRPFLVAGHSEDPKTRQIVPVGQPVRELLS
tara:strand:+ start:8916 stop:10208 length:1293 start_codon:yes stop_codon:yes gene_type:complete